MTVKLGPPRSTHLSHSSREWIPLRGDLPVADVLVQGLAREIGRSPTPESTAFHGVTGPTSWRCAMSALLVGYARCSTDQQDLTAQRDALLGLGVEAERIYVDHGLTGTNRERPGLREALAACRAGHTLVVTKLDRLARSLPDARAIADELTTRQISLSLGGSVHDPTDPVGGSSSMCLRCCPHNRSGPDPHADSRGDEGRAGEGAATREAAQAQRQAG